MLLNYSFQNYFCFKEGAEVSFELSESCPISVSSNKSYTSIICVKGANSSGKTNLLKALSFLSQFCSDSFRAYKPDDAIMFLTYFGNKEPTRFNIEFEFNYVRYKYELILTNEKVISEILFRKKVRYSKVIERKENKLLTCSNDYEELKNIKLRSNASILSIANHMDIKSLADVNFFFSSIYSNIQVQGRADFIPELSLISKHYYENKKQFEFVKSLIIKVDNDIQDITIVKNENTDEYYPIFYYDIGGKRKSLLFFVQSSGTKSLYYNLIWYKFILDAGGILILDEFDINLHPLILPNLIELFLNKESNKYDAQLLFSTHNTGILDFLGKYRTYLVNKESNESYCYRLDEIPGDILRNDRKISTIYKSGKIGGIPRI
jgi:hypothetical protein